MFLLLLILLLLLVLTRLIYIRRCAIDDINDTIDDDEDDDEDDKTVLFVPTIMDDILAVEEGVTALVENVVRMARCVLPVSTPTAAVAPAVTECCSIIVSYQVRVLSQQQLLLFVFFYFLVSLPPLFFYFVLFDFTYYERHVTSRIVLLYFTCLLCFALLCFALLACGDCHTKSRNRRF